MVNELSLVFLGTRTSLKNHGTLCAELVYGGPLTVHSDFVFASDTLQSLAANLVLQNSVALVPVPMSQHGLHKTSMPKDFTSALTSLSDVTAIKTSLTQYIFKGQC